MFGLQPLTLRVSRAATVITGNGALSHRVGSTRLLAIAPPFTEFVSPDKALRNGFLFIFRYKLTARMCNEVVSDTDVGSVYWFLDDSIICDVTTALPVFAIFIPLAILNVAEFLAIVDWFENQA